MNICPPIERLAICVNDLGTCGFTVCMHCCVTERQIFIIPRVAMNGGSFPIVISIPVNSPRMRPAMSPIMIPMMNAGAPVIPIAESSPVADESMKTMTIAPMATRVEPTARSIPPVMITNVIPSEIIPIVALFLRMLIQLRDQIENHLENEPWTPIGKSGKTFNGIFDGNGHTISNLSIDTPSKSDIGFFGFTQQGEIKNINFHNATVKGYLDVGVVAGTPYTSKYSNITLTGTIQVEGFAYVGGMFGKNAYANLTDLTIDADDESYVKAESENYRTYVGGVVGFMGEGSIDVTNVVSNINVTGSTCDVGGISGNIHYGNTFTNCSCSGDVTLTGAQDEGDQLEIGGIAGTWVNTQSQVKFSGCSFTGKLTTFLNGEDRTGDLTETHKTVGRQWSTTGSGTLIIE